MATPSTQALDFAGMLRHWQAWQPPPSAIEPGREGPTLRPLLRADEVAEALGVRAEFVYALARRGEIPHVRLGRTVRFHADEIDRWLRAGANGG